MNHQSLNKESTHDKFNLSDFDHYVAIDWSQENIALARSTRKDSKPKVVEWNESKVETVKEYFQKLRGSIILTIEETTTSHWLYVELKEYVKRIIICDPYHNRLLSDGPKTDKIDAKKLCNLLRAGILKEVYHTCDTAYQLRQILSTYTDLVKAGVRVQNQRSAVYRSLGEKYNKKNLSEMKVRISDQVFAKFVSDWQDQTIDQYFEDKETFERRIHQIVKGNKKIKNLKDIPGIGDIFAFTIYALVIQAERFKSKGHYWSYCGLVWHEKLSGNRSYGKRKPRYNRQLKSVYKTAARVAIRSGNNPVYEYYETLEEKGLPHKQASLMAARYIAKVSWGMLKSGEKYDPYKWRKDELDAA